jgi:hypothetical protein
MAVAIRLPVKGDGKASGREGMRCAACGMRRAATRWQGVKAAERQGGRAAGREGMAVLPRNRITLSKTRQ